MLGLGEAQKKASFGNGLRLAPPSPRPSWGVSACGCQEENAEPVQAARPERSNFRVPREALMGMSSAPPGRAVFPHGTWVAVTTALQLILSLANPTPTDKPSMAPTEVATGKHLCLPPFPAKPSNLL